MTSENKDMTGDWRLQGQATILMGVDLYWTHYTRWSERWDHDHCQFCSAKFMEEDCPDVLHEGYTTEDQYRWICKTCFEDFKGMFNWKVIEPPPDETSVDSQKG